MSYWGTTELANLFLQMRTWILICWHVTGCRVVITGLIVLALRLRVVLALSSSSDPYNSPHCWSFWTWYVFTDTCLSCRGSLNELWTWKWDFWVLFSWEKSPLMWPGGYPLHWSRNPPLPTDTLGSTVFSLPFANKAKKGSFSPWEEMVEWAAIAPNSQST